MSRWEIAMWQAGQLYAATGWRYRVVGVRTPEGWQYEVRYG